ncbi:MAG: phosphodiesterase [Pseudomonadota bacterium]
MARFAQITDLHLRPPGVLTLGDIDADGYTARAIDALIAKHPDVDGVLVTGDITDLGEEEAYNRAAMLLSRFSVPVLVLPGNHDLRAAMGEAFVAWPGFGAGVVDDKLCYALTVAGVTVVCLDTLVDGRPHGELGAAQLAWLDETLAGAGPTLIALHHPPFTAGIAFMDAIGLTDRDAFAAVVAKHDNVKRIVCGHVHRTIVGSVGCVPAIAVPGVAHQVMMALDGSSDARLVMEPPAYAIHDVSADGAASHVGYVDDYGAPASFAERAASSVPRQ